MIYLIGLESRWHQAPTNLLLSLFLGTWSRASLIYSTFHLFVSPNIICNLNYILEPQGPLPHLTIFPVKNKKLLPTQLEKYLSWKEKNKCQNFNYQLQSYSKLSLACELENDWKENKDGPTNDQEANEKIALLGIMFVTKTLVNKSWQHFKKSYCTCCIIKITTQKQSNEVGGHYHQLGKKNHVSFLLIYLSKLVSLDKNHFLLTRCSKRF